MINVSSEFKEALENDNRQYLERAVVTLEDSTVLVIENNDIWGGGFSIDDAVSSDESFGALGSAIVNSASLVINNIYDTYSDYVFDNAQVVMSVGLELPYNDTTRIEMVKKGTYIVDEARYNGSIITISMLDYMTFFDRPYADSSLIYPASADTIIRDACTICGVQLASTIFPNQNITFQTRPTDDAITFREVIAYVAQVCGCYARCNPDGDLELKWFDTASLEEESQTVYQIDSVYSSEISVDDVVITGVRATYNVTIDGEEETMTYLSGTEGYVIEIEKNPFINGENVQGIVNRLGVQLNGLRFRKANVSHSSDPTLEAGDVAMLNDQKGNSHPILITRTKFRVGSSQNTICGAETPRRKSAARYSEQTKNYVEFRKKMIEQKEEFDRALEDLSERIDDADGMFTTQQTTPGGGTITYLHNKPLLSESDIQIMISDVGVTVTSNGTDPQPTWYGLTVDGNLISNIISTVGINANWINTGQLAIRRNGQEVFFADVDTGVVRISGNSISITAGDPISTAIGNAQTAAATYTDQQIATYADQVEDELDAIRDQLDGVVDTYYYDYAPTPNNYPASEWTTETLRSEHEGDLFLDTSTGKSYRWLKENNVWKWKEIPDTASAQALQLAQQAMDTADGKRRVFVSTPYPPYDVGDVWMDSTSGEIMTCTTARTSGSQYVSTDFEKLNDYGEDNAIHLETPFEWSQNGQTANFTAVIYKGEEDVTADYPAAWFEWTLRTENGETQIATGKTCSVSKSALGYGGTVTCIFTTYETATLTTRSLKALNTRSGLRLTTYVTASGDQPVTELPYKSASEVNLSDYIMGIDAADGYQVSVEDFGLKLRDAIYDPRYVLKSGDTMTGNLTARFSSFDLSLSNNGVTAIVYPTTYNIQDSAGRITTRLEGVVNPNGSVGAKWYVRNYNTSGTSLGTKGIQMDMDKSGNLTYTVSDPTKFLSAIGAVNKAGDTMTGSLAISTASYSQFISKNTAVAADATAITTQTCLGSRVTQDKNGYACFYTETQKQTSGAIYQSFVVRHKVGGTEYAHGFYLTVSNAGAYSVSFTNNSSRDAWATGLNVVKKAGDTMSGNLGIAKETPAVILKYTNQTIGTAPSSNFYGGGYILRDNNDRAFGYFRAVHLTNGSAGFQIEVVRSVSGTNVYNGFSLRVANDGTRIVEVSEAAKWRNALGASSGVWPVSVGGTGTTTGIKGWTKLVDVATTAAQTLNLANYTEILIVAIYSSTYMSSVIFPVATLNTTVREVYLGGWGNNGSTSNRRGACKLSSTSFQGIGVRIDNEEKTNATWRVYAR